MTDIIEFVDGPPRSTRGPSSGLQDVADVLVQNPDQWALVAYRKTSSLATSINRNAGVFDTGEIGGRFEATSRAGEDEHEGTRAIYARYVSPEVAEVTDPPKRRGRKPKPKAAAVA